MDSSSRLQPSGLPRPKSTNLLRHPAQPLTAPPVTRPAPLLISRKPSMQLRSKSSSNHLTQAGISTNTPRTRSGITTTGKTQIVPKGPIDKVKKLLPVRSMLQLPTARRQVSTANLAVPSPLPLGAKRTVSSASTRSISVGIAQPVQGLTKQVQTKVQPSRTQLRVTPSSPLSQPLPRLTKQIAQSTSQPAQPPVRCQPLDDTVHSIPHSRLAIAYPLSTSSSSRSSSTNSSNPSTTHTRPKPTSDIFTSHSPIRAPLHSSTRPPYQTRQPHPDTPSPQKRTTQTPSRRLPPSMIDTPLLPRLITRPFTSRDGMGLEMIKDAEMSFEDSSGEFSPVVERVGGHAAYREEEIPSVSTRVSTPTAGITSLSRELLAIQADLEASRRETRELQRDRVKRMYSDLIRGIEEQLDDNEGVKRMVQAFRNSSIGALPL